MLLSLACFILQAELERPQSGTGEEEDTGDEEGRSEKRQLKMKSRRVSLTPTTSVRTVCWSEHRAEAVSHEVSQTKLTDSL